MVGIMTTKYDELSNERKQLQKQGLAPDFFTTGSWQLFKANYLWAETPLEQYQAIAKTLSNYVEGILPIPDGYFKEKTWNDIFFNILWEGLHSPSTPELSNIGCTYFKGLPVACSSGEVQDSIESFYSVLKDTANLTKYGFGTSVYLGHIRPRGSKISSGGVATGIEPVVQMFRKMSNDVSQSGVRRGSIANYIPIEHGDFWEICQLLDQDPDSLNIGWVWTNEFKVKLDAGDEEALARYKRILKLRMITGKGYIFKVDHANEQRPQCYKDKDLTIKTSNLCCEVSLFTDEFHDLTCVLGSMNISKWDKIKNSKAIFASMVFQDCVVSHFIKQSTDMNLPLEKAIRFTEKGRAIGIGQLGFSSYLQSKMISFEEYEAHRLTVEISKRIFEETLEASEYMARYLGEPEWCKGYGVRNTHRLNIAPNKSTAVLMGGISESTSPDVAMAFSQSTPAGEVPRINPQLLKLMKDRGTFTKKHISEIIANKGSVENVNWLNNKEKEVFKTAFAINQEAVVRLASVRQKYIDQSQSLNLFFSGNDTEEEISRVHKLALNDPNIISLYYCYSTREHSNIKNTECISCAS